MPIIQEDPFHKYDPDNFKFNGVKGEVVDATYEDWKRDKVDDAKKRAIYDCRNYDEFRDRVKGCTLKPIHRNEFNAPPKFYYNRGAMGGAAETSRGHAGYERSVGNAEPSESALRAAAAVAAKVDGKGTAAGVNATAFRSLREFEREFRRCSTAQEKTALLERFDSALCAKLFGRELDAELLRQLLVAIDEAGAPAYARSFLAELVDKCPSASTTAASFFTGEERRLVARILARGGAEADAAKDAARICAALGVQNATLAEATAELAAERAAEPAAAEPAAAAAPAAATEAPPPVVQKEPPRPQQPPPPSSLSEGGGGATAVAVPVAVVSCDEMD